MQQEDLLDELQQEPLLPVPFTPFRLIIMFFVFHMMVSIVMFFFSITMAKIDWPILRTYPLVIVNLIVVRLLPVAALLLFVFRKKWGWILMSFLTVIDIMFKGEFLARVFLNFGLYMRISSQITLCVFLTFVLSCIILWLLYQKKLTSFFLVDNKIKWYTLGLSIGIFSLLKLYLTAKIALLSGNIRL